MSTASLGIIFFSRDGNTQALARLLAEQFTSSFADRGIVRLQERRGRKGFLGFMRSGFQAVRKRSSVLEGDPWGASRDYTHLILMTPIWAGNGTPAMQAFLDQSELEGKTIDIITVQADPKFDKIERTHLYLKELAERHGGIVKECIAVYGSSPGRYAGDDHIRSEAERIAPRLFTAS